MKITKQGQESPNLCNIPYYNYKEEEEEEKEDSKSVHCCFSGPNSSVLIKFSIFLII